ncbi:protein of unknown function (plasmid) [Caballeronia sp. S22]
MVSRAPRRCGHGKKNPIPNFCAFLRIIGPYSSAIREAPARAAASCGMGAFIHDSRICSR